MGSRKKQTVGYRYLFGKHDGIGRGPMDELLEIKVGDRTAWRGSVTANASIQIDAPDLFGGDDKEGGIVGQLDVMMGEPTQALNVRLAAMLGGLVPNFRGITSTFFDGLMCSGSPYPKPWTYRWRRALKGWDGEPWYPAKAVINMTGPGGAAIKAMNPAHILYECFTNADWGRGLARARLDDAAWVAAADKLHAEGFGLCLKWSRQDAISAFMQGVVDHISAVLFTDPSSGLVALRLIRDDYVVASLPLFDADSGLLAIDDDDAASQGSGINEVVVKFRSPIDGKDRQVRVKNPGAIHALGGVASVTKDYPGLPTAELATRVAQRDLRASTGFIKRFKVRLDRRGYQLLPGSVFRIRDTKRGIDNMVLRAGRVERGTLTEGAITITALQDVFGLPATSYVSAQVGGWVAPVTTPVALATGRLMEVPYRDLAAQLDRYDLANLDPAAAFLAAVAGRPNATTLGFQLRTRPGASGAFSLRAEGTVCPVAHLAADLSITGAVATLVGGIGLDLVLLGSAAVLGDEIVRVDAIDLVAGTVALGRGCADTVPVAHPAGTVAIFYQDTEAADSAEYVAGTTLQAKLIARASAGLLAEADAATMGITLGWRQARPYAPGDLRIAGLRYPAAVTDMPVIVQWAHRDRLLQADQLVDTLGGDVGPEAGTTYNVEVKNAGTGLVVASGTAVAGAMFSAGRPVGAFTMRVRVWASRGVLDSHQVHEHTFSYLKTTATAEVGGEGTLLQTAAGGVLYGLRQEADMPLRRSHYYRSSAGGAAFADTGISLAPVLLAARRHTYLTFVQAGVLYYGLSEASNDYRVFSMPTNFSAAPTELTGELRPLEPGTGSPISPNVIGVDAAGAAYCVSFNRWVYKASAFPTWVLLGELAPAADEAYDHAVSFFPFFQTSTPRRLLRTSAGWILAINNGVFRTADADAQAGWRKCMPLNNTDYSAPTMQVEGVLVDGASIYVACVRVSGGVLGSFLAISRDSGVSWATQNFGGDWYTNKFAQIVKVTGGIAAIRRLGGAVALNDGTASTWTEVATSGLGPVAGLEAFEACSLGGRAFVLETVGAEQDSLLRTSTDGINWATASLP